ncbi:MAG TPA: hypothetical protein DCS07_00520 [Bdellovibrionales bacterium]|nr:MAG: hypothetical protein A2Z97_02500 [Bdellovibrionales bacterium GWB1_52_6]OFZ03507.1 MAG: hypothetical protein A2X97_06055 [Bdellovibrionales bacterium GWA1_52_35]OFZ37122.1 MAG: hypothetical protein A2070_04075 [Bdellovibrionales bacterium GWC1_52_8]HAR41114.1 hypothetical protein [Bdellovibrionales bacterium]HCM41093.1 hypothetical protein [Bdellovibrionales bacterium]
MNNRQYLKALVFALVLCSGAWAAPAADLTAYKEIQTLFAKGALELAKSKSEAFKTQYPESTQTGSVENLLGLIFVLNKEPKDAVPHFERALELGANAPNFKHYVLYNLATAQYQIEDFEDSQETLDKIRPELLDANNRIKFLHLKSQLLTKRGDFAKSAREILTNAPPSKAKPDAPDLKDSFDTILDLALTKIEDLAVLENLYADFPSQPRSEHILLELTRRAVTSQNAAKAHHYLKLLSLDYPKTASYQLALEAARSVQEAGPVNTMAIGVLLPLKGRFSKFGQRSLEGIQQALGIFNEEEPDSKITLYIEDSGEEPEQAIAGLNRLVYEHHVISIIGPLLAKGIDQVSRRAQELRIPILTLARYTGTEANEFAIHAGFTMKAQAQEMAKYAIQQLKLTRFAILASRDKTGEESAKFFWDAVEALDGEIVGYETYTPGETDFRQPVDKLSGLFYPEARQRELDELAKAREENQIKKRTRKTEKFFGLPPIVDYQAVFIPDEPKVTGQILPTFAYRDVDGVNFLGTAAWNSPELFLRAQQYANRAIFSDVFHSDPKSKLAGRFIEKFTATFEHEPTALEAVAYDATKVLEYLLNQGLANRTELLDKLKDLQDFNGVTGKFSYNDGQLVRTPQFLVIQNGVITEATR